MHYLSLLELEVRTRLPARRRSIASRRDRCADSGRSEDQCRLTQAGYARVGAGFRRAQLPGDPTEPARLCPLSRSHRRLQRAGCRRRAAASQTAPPTVCSRRWRPNTSLVLRRAPRFDKKELVRRIRSVETELDAERQKRSALAYDQQVLLAKMIRLETEIILLQAEGSQ